MTDNSNLRRANRKINKRSHSKTKSHTPFPPEKNVNEIRDVPQALVVWTPVPSHAEREKKKYKDRKENSQKNISSVATRSQAFHSLRPACFALSSASQSWIRVHIQKGLTVRTICKRDSGRLFLQKQRFCILETKKGNFNIFYFIVVIFILFCFSR